MRSVAAFLIAPLVPGMLLALFSGPLILLFAIPLGYMGAVFALPLYWLVRRFWRVSFLSCITSGFIAGALVSMASGLFGAFELSASYAVGILMFALFGVVAGAAFYWIIRLPRHSSEPPARS